MKQEYNFSNGERGKFYNAEAQLEIPIDLEPDAASFLNGLPIKKALKSKRLFMIRLGKIAHRLRRSCH